MAATDSAPEVEVTIVALTDVGRAREHNEDCFLVLDRPGGKRAGNGEMLRSPLATATVFAVADGMGGAAAGEVASRMTAERLAQVLGDAEYKDVTPDQIAALMDHAIHAANDEILAEARANAERRGMGSTCTAAVATPGRLFLAQIGDSRGYLLRKGKLVRLTKDQSLIEQLIEEGTLTEEEAEHIGGRNIVLQAVGVDENLQVQSRHLEVLRGDVVLLCSDGLTGMVKDAEIERILVEGGDDLAAAANRLIDAANAGGGRDNITVVLARFDGGGLRAPLEPLTAEAGGKSGTRFHAPPPPDVPNPMKRVGIALGVIIALLLAAFFLLRRTTADLGVLWTPRDLPARIALRARGQTTDLRTIDGSGGAAHLDGLAPGEYDLVVSAPHYFETTTQITILGAGDATESVTLRPRPGSLRVTVKTPGVFISVDAAGSGAPDETPLSESFPWPDPSVPKVYESGVPAGPVRVRVSRDGFAEHVHDDVLSPEGDLAVAVPELRELRGVLEIVVPGPGFRAEVRAANAADVLAQGDTGADGTLRLDVRVGNHSLRVTKPGFEPLDQTVGVTEGATTRLELALRVEDVPLSVTGVPGSRFTLQEQAADGTWTDVGVSRAIGADGIYPRELPLTPGTTYRIVREGSPDTLWEHTVAAGDGPLAVVLR